MKLSIQILSCSYVNKLAATSSRMNTTSSAILKASIKICDAACCFCLCPKCIHTHIYIYTILATSSRGKPLRKLCDNFVQTEPAIPSSTGLLVKILLSSLVKGLRREKLRKAWKIKTCSAAYCCCLYLECLHTYIYCSWNIDQDLQCSILLLSLSWMHTHTYIYLSNDASELWSDSANHYNYVDHFWSWEISSNLCSSFFFEPASLLLSPGPRQEIEEHVKRHAYIYTAIYDLRNHSTAITLSWLVSLDWLFPVDSSSLHGQLSSSLSHLLQARESWTSWCSVICLRSCPSLYIYH